jgi:hypothetical protein
VLADSAVPGSVHGCERCTCGLADPEPLPVPGRGGVQTVKRTTRDDRQASRPVLLPLALLPEAGPRQALTRSGLPGSSSRTRRAILCIRTI